MTVVVDIVHGALWTTWRAVPMAAVLQARRWSVGRIEDALAQRLWGGGA